MKHSTDHKHVHKIRQGGSEYSNVMEKTYLCVLTFCLAKSKTTAHGN